MKLSDQTLLNQFIRTRSDAAFDQLVRRHAGVVHGSILRKVRNPALADDATQAVFLVLAQKAPTLANRPALGGWLLKTAQFAAGEALRKESRHARHERRASQQRPEAAASPIAPADEAQLATLDDALASLASLDREALMLRYYQDESFADIAIALGTTEEGARKRTARALDKLRRLLKQRGTALSAAALAALMAGSAKSASAAALASSSTILAATSRGVSISKGVFHMLAAAKLKLLAAVGLTSVTCATAGLVIYVAMESGKAPDAPVNSPIAENVNTTPDAPLDATTSVDNSSHAISGAVVTVTNADGTTQELPLTLLKGTSAPDPAAASGTIKTVVFLLDKDDKATPVSPTDTYESSVTGQDQNPLTGVSSLNLIAKGVIVTNPAVSIPDGGKLMIGGQKFGDGSDRTVVYTATTYNVRQQDKPIGNAGTTMTVITDGKTPATLTIKSDDGQTTTLNLPNGADIITQPSGK